MAADVKRAAALFGARVTLVHVFDLTGHNGFELQSTCLYKRFAPYFGEVTIDRLTGNPQIGVTSVPPAATYSESGRTLKLRRIRTNRQRVLAEPMRLGRVSGKADKSAKVIRKHFGLSECFGVSLQDGRLGAFPRASTSASKTANHPPLRPQSGTNSKLGALTNCLRHGMSPSRARVLPTTSSGPVLRKSVQ